MMSFVGVRRKKPQTESRKIPASSAYLQIENAFSPKQRLAESQKPAVSSTFSWSFLLKADFHKELTKYKKFN